MDKHRLYLTYYGINIYTGSKRRLYTTADLIAGVVQPHDTYDFMVEDEGLVDIGTVSYEGEDEIDIKKWKVGSVDILLANHYMPADDVSSTWGDITRVTGWTDWGWGYLSGVLGICCGTTASTLSAPICLLEEGEVAVIEATLSLPAIYLDSMDSADSGAKTFDRILTYQEHTSPSPEPEPEILLPPTYERGRAYPHETHIFRGIVDIDSIKVDQQQHVTALTLIGYEKFLDNMLINTDLVPFSSLDEIIAIISASAGAVVTDYVVSDYISLIMNWLQRVAYKVYDLPEGTYMSSPFVNVTRCGTQHYIHNVPDTWEPVPDSIYTYLYGVSQLSYPIPGEDPDLRGYVAEDQGTIYTGDVPIHSAADAQLVDLFDVTVIGEADGPPSIAGHARHHREIDGVEVFYQDVMDFFPLVWANLGTIPSAWGATTWTKQPYIPKSVWGTGPYVIDGNTRWQRRPIYGAGFCWGAFHLAGLHITRGSHSEANPIGSTNYDGHDISVTDGILLTVTEIPYDDTGGGISSRATSYINLYYYDGNASVDDDGQYYRLAQYAWTEFTGEAADGYTVYWFSPWDRFIIVSPDRTRSWVYPDPYERSIDGRTRGNEFNMPPGLIDIPYASEIFVRPVNSFIGATYCTACIYYKSTINDKWNRQYVTWTTDGMTVITTPLYMVPRSSADILSSGTHPWTGTIPTRPIFIDESSAPGTEATRIWWYDQASKSLICTNIDLDIMYAYALGYDQAYMSIGGTGDGIGSQPTSLRVHIAPWASDDYPYKPNCYIVLSHFTGHPEDCVLLPVDQSTVGSILDSISKNYNYYYSLTPSGSLRLSPRYLGELRSKQPKIVAASGLSSAGQPTKNEFSWSIYPHRYDRVTVTSSRGEMGHAGSARPTSTYKIDYGSLFFNKQYGSVWSQYLYMLYSNYRRQVNCVSLLWYDYVYNRVTPFLGDFDPASIPAGYQVPGQFWVISEDIDIQRDTTALKLIEKLECDPDLEQIGLTTCIATGYSWNGQQWSYIDPSDDLEFYSCFCPDCQEDFILLLKCVEDMLNYGYIGADMPWTPAYMDEANLLSFIMLHYMDTAYTRWGSTWAMPLYYYFSSYIRCYALNSCEITS